MGAWRKVIYVSVNLQVSLEFSRRARRIAQLHRAAHRDAGRRVCAARRPCGARRLAREAERRVGEFTDLVISSIGVHLLQRTA